MQFPYPLDTFQNNAIRSIQSGHSVLVSAPTGSGKTLIAEYAVQKSLELGKRVIYTAPIKALSNQKFRDFRKQYGENVGIVTGDVSILPDAQILLMTTEIFRNCIFENSKRLENVLFVIFDEIHFINDESRGTVWEESIIFTPPHIQIICLSATVPNLVELGEWMVSVRHCPLDVIEERKRAVPLVHLLYNKYGTFPAQKLLDPRFVPPTRKSKKFFVLDEVIEKNHLPALVFSFNRKSCERKASQMKGHIPLSVEEKKQLQTQIYEHLPRFGLLETDKNPLLPLLSEGIGYHHAGMLPLWKELVECLFSTGLIKMLFTTETFAMGVNMPAYAVVFTELRRWNGTGKTSLIKAGSYHQMAGRAGRRGMDQQGYVYAPFDEDRSNTKKFYDLIYGDVEKITSQFNLSYSTLLSLYLRLGEGLFEVCDKSLSIYLKTKGQTSEIQHELREEQHREVRKRLKVLQLLHYVDEQKLCNKGLFASQISGYEIHLTEFFFAGLFENLTLKELAILLNAIVFEGKRSDSYAQNSHSEKEFATKAEELIQRIQKLELLHQIKDPLKLLDFRLASAVESWVEGCRFEDLVQFTSCSPGDFVRTIRMTLQLIRQLLNVTKEHKGLREQLMLCFRTLNRDQVDAERQLTLL